MTDDEALGDTVDGVRHHVRARMRPGWRRTRSMVLSRAHGDWGYQEAP
jgi:hypothetical protein